MPNYSRLPNGEPVPIRWRAAYGLDTAIHDSDQVEFMMACQREKERLRRMLAPAEILRVAKSIGYRKVIDVRETKDAAPDN